MPVIKSAQKKLRKDKKRTIVNNKFRSLLESAIKKAKKTPTLKTISTAFSLVDKATKNHIVHKNKAARVKSMLSKLVKSPAKSISSKKVKKTKTK